MRPPKQHQSAIRTPLNRILGAEANIRILRVLSRTAEPINRTELARRADLEPKGAHVAASRLFSAGVLKRVGSGSQQQVQLELKHPLVPTLQVLFRAEQERVDRILDGVGNAAKQLSSQVDAVWVQGPFAAGRDQPGEAIRVGAMARGEVLPTVLTTLQQSVARVEKDEDVTIEVKGMTRADVAVASSSELDELEAAVPLFGPPPLAFMALGEQLRSFRNSLTHSDRDREHLAMAHEIARRLARDPSRLEAAKEYLAKRMKSASEHERHALREWESLLQSMSVARLQRFLTDTSERATRLRQTMPFMDVLSAAEREEILAKVRSQ